MILIWNANLVLQQGVRSSESRVWVEWRRKNLGCPCPMPVPIWRQGSQDPLWKEWDTEQLRTSSWSLSEREKPWVRRAVCPVGFSLGQYPFISQVSVTLRSLPERSSQTSQFKMSSIKLSKSTLFFSFRTLSVICNYMFIFLSTGLWASLGREGLCLFACLCIHKIQYIACPYEVLSKYVWSDWKVKYRLETIFFLTTMRLNGGQGCRF